MRTLGIPLIMFFYLSMNQFVYAQAQNPAVITGVNSGGVGFVTVTTDQNGINAQVGAWGTPYPYGTNGPPLPGVEPSDASILSVDISVGNGGLLQFSYSLNTYDAALYDWLDISLSTPTGIVPIVTHLGKSGGDWGTFFQSPNITISQSLDQWKNQNV